MEKTRLSFFYLVFYLVGGGLGFAADPQMALGLFGSTGEYAEPMVRLAGVLMLGLGAMVVQLIRYTPKATVDIKRGENRGRKIVYHNVVRKMLPVGMWYGKDMKITLPKSGLMADGIEDCVAVLQVDGTGPIIGASRLSQLTN